MTADEILEALESLNKKERTKVLRSFNTADDVIRQAMELPEEARERFVEILESGEQVPIAWYNGDGELRGSERPLEGRCGKQLVRTDPPRYCMRYPTPGRPSCYKCGNGRFGESHGSYKGKGTPKYRRGMPRALRERYEGALRDDDIASLRDELALLTARIGEILENLEELPPWERATQLYTRFLETGDGEDLQVLGSLLYEGNDAANRQGAAWDELKKLIDLKAKTSAAEWKRLKDLETMVTVEDALMFAQSFIDAAARVIEDKKLLYRLQEETLCLLPPAS